MAKRCRTHQKLNCSACERYLRSSSPEDVAVTFDVDTVDYLDSYSSPCDTSSSSGDSSSSACD